MLRIRIILIIILSFLFIQGHCKPLNVNNIVPNENGIENKSIADDLYLRGNYESAIELYTYIIKHQGVSPELYYNLGNCYYQLDSIPQAILYYEKSLKLDPSDVDTRSNLSIARSQITNVGSESSDFILFSWWRTFSNSLSLTTWRVIGYCIFIFVLFLLCYQWFTKKEKTKKAFKYITVILIIIFVVIQMAAWQQFHSGKYSKNAIVMIENLPLRNAPDKSSPSLFNIPSGARLNILDDDLSDWCEVRFENGKEGWVEKKHIEMI